MRFPAPGVLFWPGRCPLLLVSAPDATEIKYIHCTRQYLLGLSGRTQFPAPGALFRLGRPGVNLVHFGQKVAGCRAKCTPVPPSTGTYNPTNIPADIPNFSRQHPVPAVPKRIFYRAITGYPGQKTHYIRYISSYSNTALFEGAGGSERAQERAGGYLGAGASPGLMGEGSHGCSSRGQLREGRDQCVEGRGALGKQEIPTIATPGTREAAEAARIYLIARPEPSHGPGVTWLSPREGGKGYYPWPRQILG